mmetsp:Transcript_42338/g.76824  ORF Transcript_42338/g.76824 Transcript_42338/m.76824 type:complete len:148 (+) Transcript_42338:60-503(+)
MAAENPPGSIVDGMEVWLSSAEFDETWRECYDMACRGSGRSDRNIPASILFQTAAAVHDHLPAGELEALIPQPDADFVRGALEVVGCTDDIYKAGIKDLEHFEAALVVVYTHLAHCAELLRRQSPEVVAALRPGAMHSDPSVLGRLS